MNKNMNTNPLTAAIREMAQTAIYTEMWRRGEL